MSVACAVLLDPACPNHFAVVRNLIYLCITILEITVHDTDVFKIYVQFVDCLKEQREKAEKNINIKNC